MNYFSQKLILIFIVSLFFYGCQKEIPEITLASLLEEMVDRESLSQYPDPYYVCKQFSSYDRATVTPDDKSWFANWDRSMFIRLETYSGRKEYVMMDADGPGAIVRFWMTFAGEDSGKGILRVYLDNYPSPVIEGTAFDIISKGGLVGEPLSASVSDSTAYEMRGHNLYLPIPYAKHCKVTYESENIKDAGAKTGGESVYYNINYRTYIDKVKIESYSKDVLKKYEKDITLIQNKLKERTVSILAGKKTTELKGSISVGNSLETSIDGKAAIRQISFKIDAKNIEQALRSTILNISFDGHNTVQSPIGDFFGTGYQVRKSSTWYTLVEADGTMTCFWVMPFMTNCTIKLENRGAQDVTISRGEIVYADYKWNKNTMYFGTSWKQYTKLETGEMKNNEGDGDPFDINYVTLKGRGVYVGDAITLFNTVYAWWGEGDEKVYVDNEIFPSHIGTGTEDYYGYAWCRPEKFVNHPFIAQPDGSGNFDPGYTVNLRFRALDAIPFKQTIKFDMEMWHWTKATINFAPVTFWYIHPDDADQRNSELQGATEPVVLKRKDLVSSAIKDNKIECENMNLEFKSDGQFRYGNNVKSGWSNNMQMIWSKAKPGSVLELSFESDIERAVDAIIVFSKAPNYGKCKMSINDSQQITLDGQSDEFELDKIRIKDVTLKKGENIFKVTLPPFAQKETTIGVDCIVFE